MKLHKKKDNKKLRIREWTAYLWCIDKETLKDTKGKATCHKDQQQQNIPVRWEGEIEKGTSVHIKDKMDKFGHSIMKPS